MPADAVMIALVAGCVGVQVKPVAEQGKVVPTCLGCWSENMSGANFVHRWRRLLHRQNRQRLWATCTCTGGMTTKVTVAGMRLSRHVAVTASISDT